MIALILSGNHAVEAVRKMVGNTVPLFAEPGTIRSDFSIDSPDLSMKGKRAVQNLVHASSTIEEANREISLWFEFKNLQ
jgi:nucleoside-diphosphate kinase